MIHRRRGRLHPGQRPAGEQLAGTIGAQLEQLERSLGAMEWTREALQRATVNVVCAVEDRDRVQSWVDALDSREWFRVRTSCFLAPGRALYWQPDGVLAPRTPTLLAVRLPRSS
jgi:hypothetical protein